MTFCHRSCSVSSSSTRISILVTTFVAFVAVPIAFANSTPSLRCTIVEPRYVNFRFLELFRGRSFHRLRCSIPSHGESTNLSHKFRSRLCTKTFAFCQAPDFPVFSKGLKKVKIDRGFCRLWNPFWSVVFDHLQEIVEFI